MRLRSFLVGVFLMCFFLAQADQHALLRKEVAEKTVVVLEAEDQMIIYCGCCSGQEHLKVNINKVTAEGSSGSYTVRVQGMKDGTEEAIDESLDLAYAWINVEGVSRNLAWEVGLNSRPCVPSFDWETYEFIFEQISINEKDTKEFDKSFKKVKRAIEGNTGFTATTFDTNIDFVVEQVEVEKEPSSRSIVISHAGKTTEQRYTIPLKNVYDISVSENSLSFSLKEDGEVMVEELENGKFVYRMFYWEQEISFQDADAKLLEEFNVLIRTCDSMTK